mmetsp:Transcript_17760/g.36078  ORF Transcript_17760/g.36078 Transcript_17760/m.36078 type:complete len:323 (+) Transcript_17760:167-1135(+)
MQKAALLFGLLTGATARIEKSAGCSWCGKDVIKMSDDFYNFRGTFRLYGLNIGTQMSMVRSTGGDSGEWVFLDSYDPNELSHEANELINKLTDNGEKVEAILNLHPFHTVHCQNLHKAFPSAKLVGTRRHKEQWPELPWAEGVLETKEKQTYWEEKYNLEFSVPEGVDFISDNPDIHFSSILATHAPSKTLHVDDTFTTVKVLFYSAFKLHPTLGKALLKEKGAGQLFTEWCKSFAERTGELGIENVAAAHMEAKTDVKDLSKQMRDALNAWSKELKAHDEKYAGVEFDFLTEEDEETADGDTQTEGEGEGNSEWQEKQIFA